MPIPIDKLLEMESALVDVYKASISGEEYHPDYNQYPKLFRQIVRSDMMTEKELRQYFRELSERMESYIDWTKFEYKKASEFIETDLEPEKAILQALLSKTLVHALVAGGNYTEQEFVTDLGWNENAHPAIQFLRKYTIQLSGQLNKTTVNRVNESIRTSISLGENKLDAITRMLPVVNDPKRAAVIAHTESIRAFSQGRLEVGRQVGAVEKEWDATINRCPICDDLSGKRVPLDKLFNGEYDSPPAHPNCRCLLRLHMPK